MLRIDWHSQKNVVSRVTGSLLANRSKNRQHKINEDWSMSYASPWRAAIYTYFGLTLSNQISPPLDPPDPLDALMPVIPHKPFI